MKKLICALVLGVFGSSCLIAWAMLTLMSDVKSAGRVLPYFTELCIVLRPVLIALPVAAVAYYFWLWFRKEEKVSRWMGFVVATMTVLIVFVLPAISTSYLLMVDQVKMVAGAHQVMRPNQRAGGDGGIAHLLLADRICPPAPQHER